MIVASSSELQAGYGPTIIVIIEHRSGILQKDLCRVQGDEAQASKMDVEVGIKAYVSSRLK
jgi:hypothetical protein